MRAMLLAAGFGERMLPLTLTLPKPAISVLGRPISVQILLRLAEAGIGEVVINLHHLPNVMRRLLEHEAETGLPRTRLVHEETILGTAGGIRNAAELLRGAGPILICNTDFLSDIDFVAVHEAHRRSGHLATLVLTAPRPGYTGVDVDAQGRVISLGGKPEVEPARIASRHLFTGCHIIDETLIDRIPAHAPSQIVRDVYEPLSREGLLGGFVHDGFWWEFGCPESYLEGSLRLLELPTAARARIARHDPVRRLDQADVALGPGTAIKHGARFRGRCALGFACHIGEGSVIEDSVVMPEAWVGPGCRLKRVVVGPAVEIPAGLELEQMLICEDRGAATELPARIRREQGFLIRPFRSQPV